MRFVILIVTVLLAIVAGFATLKLSGGTSQQGGTVAASPDAQAPPASGSDVATMNVVVARNDIPLGTVIDSSMVDVQPWPSNLVLEGFVISGTPEAKVEGLIARGDFKAREPLVLTKLGNPDDSSFLASALPSGMRAVTVAVDAVSAVAGYVFPGDRVDVVLTHSVPQDAASQLFGEQQRMGGQKPTTSEVLLSNVRVLAVNLRKPPRQKTPDGQQPVPESATAEAPSSITIELAQDDVKKLRLAEKNGTLTMALRSAKDNEADVGDPITLVDISRVEGGPGDAKGWRRSVARSVQPVDEVIIIRGVKADQSMNAAMGGMPLLPPPGVSY